MEKNYLKRGLNTGNLSIVGYRHRKLYVFVLFGLIFLTSGFGVPASIGGTATLVGCLALALLLLFCHTRMSVNMNLLAIVLLFILNILITTIYHGDEFKQFLIYAIYVVIAFIVSQTLRTDFNVLYVKLFYFLSVFSLAMVGIYLIFPAIVRLLPTISNEYGLTAYTALFSTITTFGNMAFPRNQGLFWEPGAYQTFVNIAVAIVLFSKTFENKRTKYLLVFAVTIFSTFSTTGYIVFCGLLLIYCLNEIFGAKSTNKALKYIVILMLLMIVFFVAYSMLPDDIRFQLFGKLGSYFENKNQYSSTSVRVDAFETAISNFFEHPLLGCGTGIDTTGSGETEGLMTCTPVNYFAFYGLFVGLVCNLGLFMYAKALSGKTMLGCAVFVCLSLAMISENYMRDPIILSLIFLGLSRQVNNIDAVEIS